MLEADSIISSPQLETKGVRHAFFTRQGGASEGVYSSLNGGIGSKDDPQAVSENRRRMAQHLGVDPSHFLVPYQIHSADALTIAFPFLVNERPRADALVTKTRGIGIGVTGADCGIILFADAQAGVIGAAHAGWKGALTGILETTLQKMEELGASRPAIHSVLGPTISQASYEVGADYRTRFIDAYPSYADFFIPSQRQDHFLFDLPGFIGLRLRAAGVGSFSNLALDTYAREDLFYSYRRMTHRGEADYGRQIAAIALV